MSKHRYSWAARGDINAFFGLMLDNTANLLLVVGSLSAVFGFPAEVAICYMVPGTALGVLVGDLLYFWMAFRLARRTGRSDITAMPLGLDTPSAIGMVFFVLGPAFLTAQKTMPVDEAARHTWHIGIGALLISGLFKFACAGASGWVRRMLPRAGLLGSLAAIALVFISFLPLLEILNPPIVGLVALAIILTTLVARVELPWRVPGTLAALLIAGTLYHAMQWTGLFEPTAQPFNPRAGLLPTGWLEAFRFEWLAALSDTVNYLPIVIPFALATVIGGIDCTESAAAAGDEYHTGPVIAVEAFATVVAGLCGGVIQTTPYIGHPAYKAMGGRAAYTLATAFFIGGAGLLGYFGYLYLIIPRPAVFPILVFIGLEITAQSFLATPSRHYPAVALACMPALAALAMIVADKILGDPAVSAAMKILAEADKILGDPAVSAAKITAATVADPGLRHELETLRVLANGFVVTSLLWASALAALIDRRLRPAAGFFAIAAVCTLFGVIHSPLPGNAVFLPWRWADAGLSPESFRVTLQYAIGYAAVAGLALALSWRRQRCISGGRSEFQSGGGAPPQATDRRPADGEL